MRKLTLLALMVIPFTLLAQKKVEFNDYELRAVKDLDAQDVQNQNRTGTCWSFSTLSFIESEVRRMKKMDVKLSEMWIVRHTYIEKAERYVRFHGNVNFAAGGAFHDVTAMIDKYGIVPQSEYEGLDYIVDGDKRMHNHGELNTMLQAMCDAVIKNKNRKLTGSWKKAIVAVIDSYLGAPVKNFTYNGASYTPESFRDYLGIVPEDYVILTSFTHQPMNESFVLELPDNWMHETAYNVALNEFMRSMEYSVNKGYSIAWAADVSETGFSHRNSVAIVPVGEFDGLSNKQVDSVLKAPVKQANISVEKRQAGYDNYTTTDDHGMHITGMYRDQNGTLYYKVKNSWGDDSNKCGGYLYASEAYVKYKTIDIMVHKDALPKDIKKNLGIK